MLVSLRHRLVIFAMPKCASTAIEAALGPEMDLVMSRAPGMKHTTFRRYDRHLRGFLEACAQGPLETVCLFREPVDWLRSWWKYRQRSDIPVAENSTSGMSFECFAGDYLTAGGPHVRVGRQARFVGRREGGIGIDRLFAYEDLPAYVAFLEARLERRIDLDLVNCSPLPDADTALSGAMQARLMDEMAEDFRIHAALGPVRA